MTFPWLKFFLCKYDTYSWWSILDFSLYSTPPVPRKNASAYPWPWPFPYKPLYFDLRIRLSWPWSHMKPCQSPQLPMCFLTPSSAFSTMVPHFQALFGLVFPSTCNLFGKGILSPLLQKKFFSIYFSFSFEMWKRQIDSHVNRQLFHLLPYTLMPVIAGGQPGQC